MVLPPQRKNLAWLSRLTPNVDTDEVAIVTGLLSLRVVVRSSAGRSSVLA